MSSPVKRTRRGVDRTGRSKGYDKHVRLHRWMMRSVAWQALRLPARCLLIEFYDLYTGDNNGEIFLSVRDAADRLGISKNYAQKLFGELQEKGFIRTNRRGSFSLKQRHATTWILTEFEHAGQLPTKDFMRWQPSPGKQNTVPPQGTDSTSTRDRDPKNHPQNTLDGTSTRDRDRLNGSPLGPSTRDTDSIPGRGAFRRSATTAAQPRAAALGAEHIDPSEGQP